jgi:ATP-dependent Zn protease
VTEQLPVDERHLYSEGYLKDSLAIRLGGRAAELLAFGESSTGASNDLAGATDLATRMVREFGMSKELGPVDQLAALLLERETVDGTDMDEILGHAPARPGPPATTQFHGKGRPKQPSA